jgi:hypothetical protein
MKKLSLVKRKVRSPDKIDVPVPDQSTYDPLDSYDSDNVEELKNGETHSPLELELNGLLDQKGLAYPNKRRIRHLRQYQNLSEEEFEAVYARLVMGIRHDREWEKRIILKMKEFERDYDLTDMKINDTNNLRALASAALRLEDYDSVIGQETAKGVTQGNINLLKEVGKLQEGLRNDIAKLEDTLKISRKVRKSEEEDSVPLFLDGLKKKAKEFYESKMMYIFCPDCNMLLATTWFLYPDKYNEIELTCHNKLPTGEVCGKHIKVTSNSMLKKKMSNKPEILPESIV